MIQVSTNHIDLEKGNNVYLLFGWEAIQARPNLDPYTSTLRMNDETMQVYTSDVHLKHHARRGMKAFATNGEHAKFTSYQGAGADGAIFYEKNDDFGRAKDLQERLTQIRNAHKIEKGEKDALNHCLDLPLFGYVQTAEEKFNVTNAANTLFRPSTFHSCRILPLGRNNAFATGESGASGSATVDSLEYGFFLALWEINLNMLRINASDHAVVQWEDDSGFVPWLELLANGLWWAYTRERCSSFTQRPQFAQFLLGWQPSDPMKISYANPQDLYRELPDDGKLIDDHATAVQKLNTVLPAFLKNWGYSDETRWLKHIGSNCELNLGVGS